MFTLDVHARCSRVCTADDPGDGSLIRSALGAVARAPGMTQLARDTGISRDGLYTALSAEGNPSFATVLKVAHALEAPRSEPLLCDPGQRYPVC